MLWAILSLNGKYLQNSFIPVCIAVTGWRTFSEIGNQLPKFHLYGYDHRNTEKNYEMH